ncbi:MAG TPA: DUF6458 family protein [Thermomonospora sp.]|nr:DUF6458 family protein [Thermomonospora sp.]
MGFGASLTFIAIGAILAFALKVDLSGVNIQMVGWILILVGVASMIFTFAYTRPRRRAAAAEIADEEPLYVVHPENPEPPTVDQPVPPHVHTDAAGHPDPTAPPTRPSAPTHQGTQSTPRPHTHDAPQPGRHLEEGHSRIRRERL